MSKSSTLRLYMSIRNGTLFFIFENIAAGNKKLSKIATALEVKQTGLTKYLQTLINLDILEREVPITEENPEKSKRSRLDKR